jgi:hypothetical protein
MYFSYFVASQLKLLFLFIKIFMDTCRQHAGWKLMDISLETALFPG